MRPFYAVGHNTEIPAGSGYGVLPPVVIVQETIASGSRILLRGITARTINIPSDQISFGLRLNGSYLYTGLHRIPATFFDLSSTYPFSEDCSPGVLEVVVYNKSGTSEVGAITATIGTCQASVSGDSLPQPIQPTSWFSRILGARPSMYKKFLWLCVLSPIMGLTTLSDAAMLYALPLDAVPGMTRARSATPMVCLNPITFDLESCGGAVLVHNILSTTHDDSTPATPVAGDIIRFSATWERLGIGTAGQVLTVSGGLPVWASPSGGSSHAMLSATHTDATIGVVMRGDLITGQLASPTWTRLALGAANTVLKSDGTDISWGSILSANLNITTTTCTNQFVTAISAGGVGTCTTSLLASAQFANQGTGTTVLHGNAAGNPSWGAVVLTTDISGILPLANGGTNQNVWTAARCVRVNAVGTALEAAAGDCTTGSGLTSLNGLTGSSQTFTDDTNVTIVSGGTAHVITWSGLLSVGRGGTGVSTLTGLVLGNGAAAFSAYAGSSCTNQFPRSVNASGAWTCASVVTADITDANITTGKVTTALKSGSKSVTLQNPTTALTNLIQWEFPSAITITEIVCSTDTGTATIQFDERARATPNTAGTNVLTSSLVCDTTSEASSTFSNAGIAADVPLNLQITAVASSPTVTRIHLQYTID